MNSYVTGDGFSPCVNSHVTGGGTSLCMNSCVTGMWAAGRWGTAPRGMHPYGLARRCGGMYGEDGTEDGSGRVTLRNRRFLRKYTSVVQLKRVTLKYNSVHTICIKC